MAKKYTKGALERLTEKELRKIVRGLYDTANKRIRRILDEPNIYSPAVEKRGGQLFKTTGKEKKTELINKYREVQSFLESETSTKRGARKFTEHVSKEYKRAWEKFREREEKYKGYSSKKQNKESNPKDIMDITRIMLSVNPRLYHEYDSEIVNMAIYEYSESGQYDPYAKAQSIYDEVIGIVNEYENFFNHIEWFT